MKIKTVFRWPSPSFFSKRLDTTEQVLLLLIKRRVAKRTPRILRARGQASPKIEGSVKEVCYLRRVHECYLLGSILGRVNARPRI